MNSKACAVLLFGLAACARIPAPGTPTPDSVTNAADPSQRAHVMRYARSLSFDTITHGAWDRQPLTLVDSSAVPPKDTIGPVGTIHPEPNAHRNSESDLVGVGRIVARIRTTGPYPRLALRAGESYYWVDSLRMITPDSGRGRAIFIPADSTQPITIRVMVFTTDRHGARERQALARWRYYPLRSALAWDRCTRMGCCEAQ